MNAKDLSKEAPRSLYEKIGGFAIIARTIDKCEADLNVTKGEYHFNCPLDTAFWIQGNQGRRFSGIR